MVALLATALGGGAMAGRERAARVTLARLVDPAPPAPPAAAAVHPARRAVPPQPRPGERPAAPGTGGQGPPPVGSALAAPAMPALATPTAAPTPPPPSVPAASAVSAGEDAAWRAYQALLWRRILARRPVGMTLAGRTELRFTLDTGGRLLSAEIAEPSGNALLDRLALRSLRDAAPFPPVPPSLADRALLFTVTFSFR